MIKLKFKDISNEIEFFKKIHYLNIVEDAGIRYAEVINDLDQAEVETDEEDE